MFKFRGGQDLSDQLREVSNVWNYDCGLWWFCIREWPLSGEVSLT